MYEQGPIRPPSEAGSLLVRVTRGCFYNRCAFCPVYNDAPPSSRATEEILADLDEVAAMVQEVRHLAALGGGDQVDRRAVILAHRFAPHLVPVAFWLHRGGRTVFLQDADAMAVPEERMIAVLRGIRERFPAVDRITTYARARTLVRRPVERLVRYREAGLTRVHLGMESGADAVLERMHKGCTAEHLVQGGRQVVAAGLHLCTYVMPGLGGTDLSEEHSRETARVLREIRPAAVRLRSLRVLRGTDLATMVAEGRFELPDEIDVAREIRALLVGLGDLETTLVSDHEMNLLPQLEGELPRDLPHLLGVLDTLLHWAPERQRRFVFARRAGLAHCLADLDRREEAIDALAARLDVDPGAPGMRWRELLRGASL